VYEDDEEDEEVLSEPMGNATAFEVQTEEQGGLSSPEKMAESLKILDQDVEVEDPLGLFFAERETGESDDTNQNLEEISPALRNISRLIRSSTIHVVGDALDDLLSSSRNETELAEIVDELARVFSPWLDNKPSSFSDYLANFISEPSEDVHRFSYLWFSTWSRALSKTGEIEEEVLRSQALRALARSLEIWPGKPLSERTWMQYETDRWLYVQAQDILDVIVRIESGFWMAKGLEILSSFARTIRSRPDALSNLINIGFGVADAYDFSLVSGDRERVLAIHQMTLRIAKRVGVEAAVDTQIVGTFPDIVPPIDIKPPVEPRGPRYSDFIFYYDDNHCPGLRVPETDPLQAGTWFQLEVAVRVKPIGIPFEPTERFPARRDILDPKQEHPATIWVTVQPDLPEDPLIEVEEPVQTLTLPPVGDSSQHAFFRVRSLKPSASSLDLAKFRVCLYYEFNLIEVALIQAEVVPAYLDPPRSLLGLQKPISFMQLARPREYVDFDNVLPRRMNVNIARRGERYVFNFLFSDASDANVSFFAPVSLQIPDLADALFNIRKLWYEVALSEAFQTGLTANQSEFVASVRELARAGARLWTKLFRNATKAGTSAIYKVGEWLKQHPLPSDSIIQISFESNADNFVFPWALLYDRPVPRDRNLLPDPTGFWGMRYCIEQQIPGRKYRTDQPIDVPDKMDFAFIVWDQFRNVADQKTLMTNLKSRSSGKLDVSTPPISDPNRCYELLKNGKSHILYFYTHGHTRLRKADIGVGTNFQIFIDYYKRLKRADPLRKTLYYIYQSVNNSDFEPDRSWIGLTGGKMYLDEMEGEIIKLESEPLVILNMCESAQITPSLSDSFIDFFLDRGAEGVIGTECPMTVEFAHPFAEQFLTEILTGVPVGHALLTARRYFMSAKNPLGLAYTLFGSATVRFTPPRF
jgi:hypothetical protein